MLRPATPLSILLFVAFVLLLLSVISTPIVRAIPLATYDGVDFGVFGQCKGTSCSGIQVGYSTDSQTLFGDTNENSDFSLPAGARSSLSSILIVHPVAAFLTLVCFSLAATAHLHSPSHSPRYLLALLLLLIPTFLITLLAFLVDILLFVPHLEWGGWIVLASTILIAAAGVVICAMRRTLVSRKARKKRIAENAEMNGQNFYARQQAGARAESPPPMHQSAAPTANGALGSDRLPAFTTFEKRPDVTDEERLPLNARTPSNRTVPTSAPNTGFSEEGYERYNGTGRGGYEGMRGGRGIGNSGPRDEYGNPLPPSNAFGPIPPGAVRRDQSEPPMRHQYSNETVNSQGSRGRGRGGYPPRGFGRGGPYRGGRGGPGFDSYGRGGPVDGPPPGYGNGSPFPPMARGVNRGPTGYGREQSAPGYGRRPSPGPPSAPGGYGRQPSPGPPSAPGSYGRQPSPGPPSAPGCYGRQTSPGPPSAPGGYGRQQSPGPPSAPGGYARRPSPGPPSASGGYAAYGSRGISPGPQESQPNRRSESPPPPLPIQHPSIGPIGQAVEMDAYTGSPQRSPTFHQPMLLRDSDSDVQGLVGLQQGQKHRESPLSLTSVYSSQEPYVPPRSAWANGPVRNGTPPTVNTSQPLPTVQASPVELPTPIDHNIFKPSEQQRSPSHARYNSGDNYYEDVDPRFVEPEAVPQARSPLPSALVAGGHPNDNLQIDRGNSPSHLEPSSSYEDIQEGTRSPAASDNSNYTSISQRGINPAWRPPPGQGYGPGVGGVPNRRPVQPPDILMGNPDFDLPGVGRGGRGGSRGGGGGRIIPAQVPSMMPAGGRYPGEI